MFDMIIYVKDNPGPNKNISRLHNNIRTDLWYIKEVKSTRFDYQLDVE